MHLMFSETWAREDMVFMLLLLQENSFKLKKVDLD